MKIKNILAGMLTLSMVLAQAQIPVGQWRTHLSYQMGTSITIADDLVYCVADGSMFSYRISDQSLSTYSKIDGLNDIFISKVRYDENTQRLFIAYENGNIDVLQGNQITNIPDIKIKGISGSKEMNNIRFDKNFAYVAFDFGIVLINLDRAEIKDTYKLNFLNEDNPVFDVELSGDTLFAATEKGVYYGLTSDNLIDQTKWKVLESAPDAKKPYYNLAKLGEYIVGAQADDYNGDFNIYVLNALNGQQIATRNKLRQLMVKDNELLMVSLRSFSIFDNNLSLKTNFNRYVLSDDFHEDLTILNVSEGVYAGNNIFYTADMVSGLVYHNTQTKSQFLTPNGPQMNLLRRMQIADGKLRVVHGGVDSWNNLTISPAVSVYANSRWENQNIYNNPALYGTKDFMNIVVDPTDSEHYFITSYGHGVLEFQGEEMLKIHDDGNSTLQNIIPGSPYVRVVGLAYDKDNNLWVNNCQVSKAISCLKADGEWTSFKYEEIDATGSITYALDNMMVADDGNKWVIVGHASPKDFPIFVFNENGTIDDDSDDLTLALKVKNSEDGEVISNNVLDIVQDLDGTIWVGTDDGPVLYYNVDKVFETAEVMAYRPKIPRNDGTGLADYLLKGEKVNAIAVDGGNRKWIGTTTSGLLLLSSDGLETIHHFTTENSPILSNTIIDIEIDPESGEVFIATNNGLISYRSDGTSGNETFANIGVFPNPVRDTYDGPIIVKGLVEQTNVKITDINGNLVYETTSNGGTASWDGRNFYGQRVGTGVYIVFCSDKTGENTAMTKLLFVN